MTNWKPFWMSLFIALFLMTGIAGTSMAQDGTAQDLGSYACKDVMRISGAERDLVVVALHAYLLGKNGTTKFDLKKIADSTDAFIEQCLDNPGENALKMMEKVSK